MYASSYTDVRTHPNTILLYPHTGLCADVRTHPNTILLYTPWCKTYPRTNRLYMCPGTNIHVYIYIAPLIGFVYVTHM
jgi:hypothetical protein